MIRFFVPGTPIAQPRHQITKTGRRYIKKLSDGSPHPVHAWKDAIAAAAREVCKEPITGPVAVCLTERFPRPQRLTWKRRPMPKLPHDQTPDTDNLEKAIYDALKGLAWIDDGQVYAVLKFKWFVEGGGECGALIEVCEPDELAEMFYRRLTHEVQRS